MSKPLNVAMIGYGFMGRAHSNAYRQVGQFFDLQHRPVMKVACARNAEKLRKFAENWGWESTETDWRKVVERRDVDVVDIGSPNNTHLEIALAAASHGKMILCEKPLAMDLKQAVQMTEAVEKAGVANFVWYNYRRVPAITLAKQVIDEGRLGRVFHYRACYLQDWTIEPELPQGGQTLWRLDKDVAGSGVTGDLISHSVDTAIWLNGPMTKVVGDTETFIKERPLQDAPGQTKPVGIDDACQFLARFANGAMGLFESTRYARGRKNKNWFEINGADASIAFDLEDPHRLLYYDNTDPAHLQGWRSIHVTGFNHPYMKNWWVPGTTIGYEHTFINALADFLKGLETGTPASPTFRDALSTQAVCDAVLDSAEVGQWQTVVPI
ncbi:MAG TPA: Gfo/Idh/MocA family oxidoreductase [Isosphaeraceae bacterium]|nr:Gfo/Idh/MocA family oxidoreductase [Isosphaeraceae bacterium]